MWSLSFLTFGQLLSWLLNSDHGKIKWVSRSDSFSLADNYLVPITIKTSNIHYWWHPLGTISQLWGGKTPMLYLNKQKKEIVFIAHGRERFVIPWCTARYGWYVPVQQGIDMSGTYQSIGIPHLIVFWYVGTYCTDSRSAYWYGLVRWTIWKRISFHYFFSEIKVHAYVHMLYLCIHMHVYILISRYISSDTKVLIQKNKPDAEFFN